MSEQLSALIAFAKDIIVEASDLSLDDSDVFEFALKHGLLKEERRTEPCGPACYCDFVGEGFPTNCLQYTDFMTYKKEE